jgi:hypothetical protein
VTTPAPHLLPGETALHSVHSRVWKGRLLLEKLLVVSFGFDFVPMSCIGLPQLERRWTGACDAEENRALRRGEQGGEP